MSRVLVVDENEMMRDSVTAALVGAGCEVTAVASTRAAIARLDEHGFDVVVADQRSPNTDGVGFLEAVRQRDDDVPIVIVTANGTVESAIDALERGAYDYIPKPFSSDALTHAVRRALEHRSLARENAVLRVSTEPPRRAASAREMVGDSPVMQQLRAQLERMADSRETICISGPSGVGKEVAARWIHAHSPRAGAPFLTINCAALSTGLLESELFGHERGAFAGADRSRRGRFELADGGTLVLDGIADVAPAVQARLLRVLEDRTLERVGSSRRIPIDVRVIAITHRDLAAEVAAGRFREDLYFRLNVLPVRVPRLCERREDVPGLVRHFLARIAAREARPRVQMTPAALEVLARYPWPGNVRELLNICERAVVLTTGPTIEAELLAPWLPHQRETGAEADAEAAGASRPAPASMLEGKPDPTTLVCGEAYRLSDLERDAIVATLHYHSGHRLRSAKALGIGVRTLGLKLKKWKELQLVSPTL